MNVKFDVKSHGIIDMMFLYYSEIGYATVPMAKDDVPSNSWIPIHCSGNTAAYVDDVGMTIHTEHGLYGDVVPAWLSQIGNIMANSAHGCGRMKFMMDVAELANYVNGSNHPDSGDSIHDVAKDGYLDTMGAHYTQTSEYVYIYANDVCKTPIIGGMCVTDNDPYSHTDSFIDPWLVYNMICVKPSV